MTDPVGLCECGCGQRTPISKKTRGERGIVKGQPVRFIRGHMLKDARRGIPMPARAREALRAANAGLVGPRHAAWRGGRKTTAAGYVEVWVGPDHPMANAHGRVLEHRLVMARALGRLLTAREVVHHRNGNTNDNRFEKLTLFESQADHMAHHARERAAA